MNRLKKSLSQLGAGKYNDGTDLLLHKRKDGGSMALSFYHSRARHEMGLDALRGVSFKKASERATQ